MLDDTIRKIKEAEEAAEQEKAACRARLQRMLADAEQDAAAMTVQAEETLRQEQAVLLDQATLKAQDMSARKQSLTVTLRSGLKLQLGVSGDTLCGCGGWSCPEFFEAFEAAVK